MEDAEIDAMIQSQSLVLQNLLAFADTMALKCAVELRLGDIIHSHETPITLTQIASSIDSPSPPDVSSLQRILRLLVRKKIFSVHHPSDGGETLYGPTSFSSWILRDFEISLSPFILMQAHPLMITPWLYFSQCVKEGGTAFKKAHGHELFVFAQQNPEFNRIFNDGMACTAMMSTMAILTKYKDGFKGLGSLVDVGGGTGGIIGAIVDQFPHIKGINFDLPHVIATAPEYDGVTHIGGNMFEAIPHADAVFMKWILHDWSDEDCVKILRNCVKAIPEETGKVIVVDIVLNPDGNSPLDDISIVSDLGMLAITGGKERTEPEWKMILEEGGFPRYKIFNIAPILCIIEAYTK
ncbi:Methyltransf_2 domain-containing protein/Dimerisation domain-containing protein [Cephalotus follicularis]|uniref:Methyltransf_2 domain-containing protein/Dimerisation domain-containing protein n=1 Tax=Cephalotus follicularis TaxID=3775 RepID=A0A1Q3CNQ1_CEPFO|nr:Methyltransf_2 domain-containing protein/Dimerisation domain-containing protein [Cephalotus follicularis]